jgi:hypothetical protein
LTYSNTIDGVFDCG